MKFERLDDGTWTLTAPWIDGILSGDTYAELYWKGLACRKN